MQGTALIIAAAGQGRRMGAGINKQFIELEGQTVLAHTLKRFSSIDTIGQVILLHRREDAELMRQLVYALDLPFEVTFVQGGDTRQASVFNGLKALAPNIDKVIVHDGARPFVTNDMISRMNAFIERLSKEETLDGGFFGVPLKDTIKQATDLGFVTMDRSTLHVVQTPQLFKVFSLVKAYEAASAEGFVGTDDCSLMERFGGVIEVLQGDYKNIKVTTPEDLLVAEVFLKTF